MFYRLTWLLTILLGTIVSALIWVVVTTPSATAIRGCLTTSLFHVWLCDEPGNINYLPLKEISSNLKNLVLISEDASFYGHSGFDWDELRNSFEKNVATGRVARGGSTITQQLAKNVFLNSEKTLARKVREAILTVQLESILTKDKIFEKYLNVIEFGPKIFGAEAAAKYYFNKSARDLNILEAAYLTYLIPNPKVYSRIFLKKQLTAFSRRRLTDLCFRLMQTKRITEDQYLAAKSSLDFFPWADLPNEIVSRLNNSATNTEIRDVIDESNLPAPPSTNAEPIEDPASAEPPADESSQ